MSLGFSVQNAAVGASVPVAVAADQAVHSIAYLRALTANSTGIIYYGFFATAAAALAGLTASTGAQLASTDPAVPIPVGCLQGTTAQVTGNLKYLYVLSSSGTLGVSCWGK